MKVRPPAVAGRFYPANPDQLRTAVQEYLETATSASSEQAVSPKALIAPHAGYIYSGPIAGSAYRHVIPFAAQIKRVVMLGPAHTMAIRNLAASSVEVFKTPLGEVPIDQKAVQVALSLPQVDFLDAAHLQEHGLEVHLPFLQMILDEFSLVPFVVGHTDPEEVQAVIDLLWGGPETLIVISSDLSHFLNYRQAQVLDSATCQAIEQLQPDNIDKNGACGRRPIQGLLLVAKERGMSVETLDVRNSGDTAGSKDRVVGYGAWAFR
jgi:AmmeMemoRadiSam system protein B